MAIASAAEPGEVEPGRAAVTARTVRHSPYRDSGSPTSRLVLMPHPAPNRALRLLNNIFFLVRHARLAFAPKLLYGLTPPPWIQNIGDQAQTLAILNWFARSAPGLHVLELNQSECAYFISSLRLL